jgi:hypothetical protein
MDFDDFFPSEFSKNEKDKHLIAAEISGFDLASFKEKIRLVISK